MNSTEEHRILRTTTLSPVCVAQVENETLRMCFERWEKLRGDRLAPVFSDIDLLTFPLKAIPTSTIVDISPDGADFTYRFWGSVLTQITKKDMTGESIISISPEADGKIIHEQHVLIKTTRQPALFTMQIIMENAREATETILRLPISNDGESIDHILSFDDLEINPFEFSTSILNKLMG